MERVMVTVPAGYIAIPVSEYKRLLQVSLQFETSGNICKCREVKKPEQDPEDTGKELQTAELEEEEFLSELLLQNLASASEKRPRKKHTAATKEIIEEINRKRVNGKSITEIAVDMGIPETSVRRHLSEFSKTHPNHIHKWAKNATPLADTGQNPAPV